MITNARLRAARDYLKSRYAEPAQAGEQPIRLPVEIWATWPGPTYNPPDKALLILHPGYEVSAMLGGGELGLTGAPAGTAARPGGDTMLATYLLPAPVEQKVAGRPTGATFETVQEQSNDDKERLARYAKNETFRSLSGTALSAGKLITFLNPQFGPFQAAPLNDVVRISWQASISVGGVDR